VNARDKTTLERVVQSPDRLPERQVFDAEIVEDDGLPVPANQRDLAHARWRASAATVIHITRTAATQECTRVAGKAVLRHALYVLAGALVVGRRVWEAGSRRWSSASPAWRRPARLLQEGTQDPTDQNLPKLVREARTSGPRSSSAPRTARTALGDKAVNGSPAPHKLLSGLDEARSWSRATACPSQAGRRRSRCGRTSWTAPRRPRSPSVRSPGVDYNAPRSTEPVRDLLDDVRTAHRARQRRPDIADAFDNRPEQRTDPRVDR
jgi:hypothetical protein